MSLGVLLAFPFSALDPPSAIPPLPLSLFPILSLLICQSRISLLNAQYFTPEYNSSARGEREREIVKSDARTNRSVGTLIQVWAAPLPCPGFLFVRCSLSSRSFPRAWVRSSAVVGFVPARLFLFIILGLYYSVFLSSPFLFTYFIFIFHHALPLPLTKTAS